MGSVLVDRVKSPVASFSKPGRQVAASLQALLTLRSYIGQFLEETGASLGAEDEERFPLRLLHFRRTFVEKMFAIHGKVELLKRDGSRLEHTPGTITICFNWPDRKK